MSGGRRRFTCAVAAVLIAAFGGLVWYAYGLVIADSHDGMPPMVAADDAPEKVRPEDPGGLAIANQDSTVFERIDPASGDDSVEELLPPPALPLPQPVAQEDTDLGEGEPAVPKLPTTEQLADDSFLPTASTLSSDVDADTEAVLADIADAVVEADAASQETGETTAATTTVATATAGAVSGKTDEVWRIQLSSVREESRAREEWLRLQARYPDVLTDLTPHLERADLGERGIFWRIRAGDWSRKSEAVQACAALTAQNQPCLVVSR